MFDILKRKIGEREKKEREETSKCSDFIQSKQLHEYVEKDNLWNDLKYRCTTWSNLVVLFFFVSSLILLFASLFTVSVPSSMLNPIFICTRIVFVRFFVVVVVSKWLMDFFLLVFHSWSRFFRLSGGEKSLLCRLSQKPPPKKKCQQHVLMLSKNTQN